MISVLGLSVWNKEKKILDEVTLNTQKGEIVALLGPNGSGKTTLLKTLCGLVREQNLKIDGQILLSEEVLFGSNSWRVSVGALAARFAYVTPNLDVFFPIRGKELVALGAWCTNPTDSERKAIEILKELGIEYLAEAWVDQMSGGQVQLILLARARMQNPKVYLLDESLGKMDLNHQIEVCRWIRKQRELGKTFILVTHDFNLGSEIADRAVLMKSGKIVFQGPIEEALTESKLDLLYPNSGIRVGKSPTNHSPKIFFP